MFTRLFLFAIAVLLTAFAAVSFVNPVGMAASLEVEVSGPNGAYELRGIYGGVSLGGALLCFGGAFRVALTRPALWFLTAYMGGYIFARAAALALGPPPTPVYVSFIAFELIVLAGAILGLRANART